MSVRWFNYCDVNTHTDKKSEDFSIQFGEMKAHTSIMYRLSRRSSQSQTSLSKILLIKRHFWVTLFSFHFVSFAFGCGYLPKWWTHHWSDKIFFIQFIKKLKYILSVIHWMSRETVCPRVYQKTFSMLNFRQKKRIIRAKKPRTFHCCETK